MKKVFCSLMVLFLLASVSQAQIRKIPAEATSALKAKYPNAEAVEWKDKLSSFEAKFTSGGTEMSASFSSKGEWLETDKKLTFDALPASVKDGFKKSKYADWTPGSVTEIQKKDKPVQYKVYVEKSSLVQKKFLYFDASGKLNHDVQSI